MEDVSAEVHLELRAMVLFASRRAFLEKVRQHPSTFLNASQLRSTSAVSNEGRSLESFFDALLSMKTSSREATDLRLTWMPLILSVVVAANVKKCHFSFFFDFLIFGVLIKICFLNCFCFCLFLKFSFSFFCVFSFSPFKTCVSFHCSFFQVLYIRAGQE